MLMCIVRDGLSFPQSYFLGVSKGLTMQIQALHDKLEAFNRKVTGVVNCRISVTADLIGGGRC